MDKFSLLMSIYHAESPKYLKESLESILNSTILPSQIVMVIDGPISQELEFIINYYAARFENFLRIRLDKNYGLGYALAQGLESCEFELVARFDCDDISFHDRFLKQLTCFKNNPNLVLVGGQIQEFSEMGNGSKRIVPTDYESILNFAQKRNPFNHMTVMFKKSEILEVGNYQVLSGYEDYYLWLRLLKAKKYVENIPDVVVKARTGVAFSNRRGGMSYLKNSLAAINRFEREGLITNLSAWKRRIGQVIIILMPVTLREKIYNLILRK